MTIQSELDKAEEYVLNKLLVDVRNPVIGKKIQLICIAKNIDIKKEINDKLMLFEDMSKDFMTDEGFYDGPKLSTALAIKFPHLRGLDIPNIKPIELFVILDYLIGFDSLGRIIQNL